jgi:hypothetical protein
MLSPYLPANRLIFRIGYTFNAYSAHFLIQENLIMIFAYYARDTCPKGFVDGSDAPMSPSKPDVAILQTFFSKRPLPALNTCFYPRAFPGKDFVRGALRFQMVP